MGLPTEDGGDARGPAERRYLEERSERRLRCWRGRLPEHTAGCARAGEVGEAIVGAVPTNAFVGVVPDLAAPTNIFYFIKLLILYFLYHKNAK